MYTVPVVINPIRRLPGGDFSRGHIWAGSGHVQMNWHIGVCPPIYLLCTRRPASSGYLSQCLFPIHLKVRRQKGLGRAINSHAGLGRNQVCLSPVVFCPIFHYQRNSFCYDDVYSLMEVQVRFRLRYKELLIVPGLKGLPPLPPLVFLVFIS